MGASGRDGSAGSAADDAAALARALAEAHACIVELEGLAHVDELTGVLNRRGFLRELGRAAPIQSATPSLSRWPSLIWTG